MAGNIDAEAQYPAFESVYRWTDGGALTFTQWWVCRTYVGKPKLAVDYSSELEYTAAFPVWFVIDKSAFLLNPFIGMDMKQEKM